jgi:hypothetical protein
VRPAQARERAAPLREAEHRDVLSAAAEDDAARPTGQASPPASPGLAAVVSRSRKREPVVNWATAKGQARAKRIARRKLRAQTRAAEPDTPTPDIREVSDVWRLPADGKQRWQDPKAYRK